MSTETLIHHLHVGNSVHISAVILENGEALSTHDWEKVTCEECQRMKPRQMRLHDEKCPMTGDCDCPEFPVAGW